MTIRRVSALALMAIVACGTATAAEMPAPCRASLDKQYPNWKAVEATPSRALEGDFDGDHKPDLAVLIVFPHFSSARVPNVKPATQVVACVSTQSGKALPVGDVDEVKVTSYIDPVYRSNEPGKTGKAQPTDGISLWEFTYWYENGSFVRTFPDED